MDSYFKAAVSDLDKLLDEFEQKTDEHEDNQMLNPHDSKYHLLTSERDYQQPKSLEPSVQEDSSSCAIAEELSLSIQTINVAHPDQLNSEKNVTGLDLLSMVDGDSSNENQSSSLGRCNIPVCDLINDTGNLSHTKGNSECVQKLPSDNFQCSASSLIGFDLALIPATACNLPVECRIDSSTEQQIDGDAVPCNIEYNAAEEPNQLVLRTGSPAEANVMASGGDQEKTETLHNAEVFDHKEQTVSFDGAPALIKEPISDVHSSKDDTMCENLPSMFSSWNSSRSQQVFDGESGKEAISEEDKIESIDTNLPKTYELNKNSLNLPRDVRSSDDSLPNEDVPVLVKTHSTEEKLSSSEQNTNQILNISTIEASEDIQTSLSCLPLAVSMCGSLVTTEVTNGNCCQNEAADVISDITITHTENHKSDLPQWELQETIEASEQEENVNKTSQYWQGKPSFTDREKVDFDNITSKCELPQHQNHTAPFGSLEANSEMYSCVLPTDIGDRASVDLAIDEAIIRSDMLISDAELDAFLSEHCLEVSDSKPLKEDTDDGLLESDVIQNNLIDVNQLNKSNGSEIEFKKMETYIDNSNCIVSDLKPKFGGVVEEEITLQLQQELTHVRETESQVSDLINNQQILHSGSARPKQLLNLPPKAQIGSEFSSSDTHGSESDVKDSLIPNSSCSDTKICLDSPFTCNYSNTQSCLEDEGGKELVESAKVVEEVTVLGQKQPPWVPDSEAPNCMNCQAKFTFTKRRHHCRACGKVFCGPCCNRKCKLSYLDKEARVCISCYESINKAHAFERMMSPTGPVHVSDSSEHCSTVPPLQEAQTSGLCTKEQRRVWFADGILPNGEVADTTKLSSGVRRSPQEPYPVESSASDTACTTDIKPKDEAHVVGQADTLHCPNSVLPEETLPTNGQPELWCNSDSSTPPATELSPFVEPTKSSGFATANETNDVPVRPLDYKVLCGIDKYVSREISLIPEGDGLPPLLLFGGEKGDEFSVEEHPSHKQVALLLESNPLTFILNANLLVNVRILPYCSERCWYFSTNGLHGLGQAEIIILLPCLPNEEDVPKEIFKLFINTYKDAMKGKFIGNLENITFTEGFLGSKDHGGFLFVTPTFQKLDDLALPQNPFLCGILIQKPEVPWAKVFPIRLMLRLGAEYGAYPTPLTSIRYRKPLFREIGHTVMNLLVDLRNYQYTLHTINGLFIHMEMGRSCIKIPLRKYNEVMKVVNTANEHVISIGASFSSEADSHLVCVQNDDGVYQTQANSATGQPRKITGASFVVFNGALKTSSGFLAKSSIVEDGIMVQITPETMDGLRQALREKKDFRISCGKVDSGDLREYVDICWVENEDKTNVRVTSPIDGKSMEGIDSEKIVQEQDFEMNEKRIKCTEVFYLLKATDLYIQPPYSFAKEIALASCAALRKHLKTLKSNGMNKIGLRVSMDTDMVEYQAGSGGQLLPQHYLNDLDSALIPLIHGGTSNAANLPLEMELIFFITESILI